MVDLNTLIPPGSSLELTFAVAINERGEIAGFGVPPGCAPQDYGICGHAYVLIPCNADSGACEALATTRERQSAPALLTQSSGIVGRANPILTQRTSGMPDTPRSSPPVSHWRRNTEEITVKELQSHQSCARTSADRLFTVHDFRYAWKRICDRAGVKAGREGIVLHDARRSSARNKRAAGVTSVIMDLQGWRSESMFRRYGIVDNSDRPKALKAETRYASDQLQKASSSAATRPN